jgi:excisionase family DNA binding protein
VEKLLTVKELSEIFQVSRSTIYEWSHTGFVPHYKLPKGIRFRMSEIEKWLIVRRKKGRKRYKINVEH